MPVKLYLHVGDDGLCDHIAYDLYSPQGQLIGIWVGAPDAPHSHPSDALDDLRRRLAGSATQMKLWGVDLDEDPF